MKRRTMQKLYITGGGRFIDGSIYIEQKVPRNRAAKYRPTSEAQRRLNEDNARRRAARILQENFRPMVDFIVHPTYRAEAVPDSAERVRKDMRNLLSRIKRLYQRLGIKCEFKYFGTAVGGEKIRRHIHLVITGDSLPGLRDYIEALWKHGTCNVDRIQPDGEYGLSGIASYICKNHAEAKEIGENIFAKHWCASRNLVDPEPSERRGALPLSWLAKLANSAPAVREEMLEALYPNYKTVEIDVSEIKDAPADRKYRICGNYYVFFRMRRKTKKELDEMNRRKRFET